MTFTSFSSMISMIYFKDSKPSDHSLYFLSVFDILRFCFFLIWLSIHVKYFSFIWINYSRDSSFSDLYAFTIRILALRQQLPISYLIITLVCILYQIILNHRLLNKVVLMTLLISYWRVLPIKWTINIFCE